MRVGFIGVGQMGSHMARNIKDAGFDLVINDVDKDAAVPLLEGGAVWAPRPAAVAESCRVVTTSLPTPQVVEDVVLGPSGLKESWQAGDIYVDMTTNSVSTVPLIAQEAARLGVGVLDAPVSGVVPAGPTPALSRSWWVVTPLYSRRSVRSSSRWPRKTWRPR